MTDWPAVFRELDEPVTPIDIDVRAFLHPVDGSPGKVRLDESAAISALSRTPREESLERPRDFDLTATQARFDRLAQRLSEAFGCACGAVLGQDSACFGTIHIPAEATITRTKRTRIAVAFEVSVSSFGALACYEPSDQAAPVHPHDRERIEAALTGLGYRLVPRPVLDEPYDGPNGWVFTAGSGPTWHDRFFAHL